MTKATYPKKALKFLLHDFERRCAYCLDPDEFRHPSQSQVDHFNCKLKSRKRNLYKNLMLACAACNLSKHDKMVVNPFDKEQRLLNCTEENEFLGHIVEMPDGQWEARTKAGKYHLESIGLREECHRKKRAARKEVLNRVVKLCTGAVQYKSYNPIELHNEVMATVVTLVEHLDNFPPLVTDQGVVSAREQLKKSGINLDVITAQADKKKK
jgi:hypothetical protein